MKRVDYAYIDSRATIKCNKGIHGRKYEKGSKYKPSFSAWVDCEESLWIYIATLKKQYSDDLDFPEVSIWGLEEILEQAYMLGREDAKNDSERKK